MANAKRRYGPGVCIDCGRIYGKSSGNQVRCEECRMEHERLVRKIRRVRRWWRKSHTDIMDDELYVQMALVGSECYGCRHLHYCNSVVKEGKRLRCQPRGVEDIVPMIAITLAVGEVAYASCEY